LSSMGTDSIDGFNFCIVVFSRRVVILFHSGDRDGLGSLIVLPDDFQVQGGLIDGLQIGVGVLHNFFLQIGLWSPAMNI
jgi:hypothetical protein